MQKKKLLGSTLALAMLVSSGPANAELLKNFKLGGQIDVQATAAKNVTDFATRRNVTAAVTNNDRIGDAQTRIMLHMDWDLLDDVHSKVTLRKSDRNYGTAGGGNANTNANSQVLQTGAGAGVMNNIFLDQAYFKIDKVFDAVDATFGRQWFGNSGDLVIYYGPSDKARYGLPTTSIDALRADWSNDQIGVSAMAGKTVGTAVGTVPQTDTDVRGVNVSFKGNDMWNGAVYLWNQLTHRTGASGQAPSIATASGQNDRLYVLGVKGKVMMGMAWAAAELAKNFGENRASLDLAGGTLGSRSYAGWAFKADIGAKAELDGIGAVMPWLHFGYGTGSSDSRDNKNRAFTAISGDYRPGAIYGRFPALLGSSANIAALGTTLSGTTLSNRVITGVGVNVNPAAVSKLTAGVSAYNFRSQTRYAAITPGAQSPLLGNRNLGMEYDLDLTWKHSDNVSMGAGVATFQPGGAIGHAAQSTSFSLASARSGQPVNNVNLAYFDLRLKF